jgi:hypothetical protein
VGDTDSEIISHDSSKRVPEPEHLVHNTTQRCPSRELVREPLNEAFGLCRLHIAKNALKEQECRHVAREERRCGILRCR